MNIDNYFPYDEYRKGQREAIAEIIDAIDSDYANIIVDAPTGFGKSAVVRTVNDCLINEVFNKSYILTATKMLQDQYYNDCKSSQFVDYRMMKGRSNFICAINGKTCDAGHCQTIPKGQKYNCIYGIVKGDPLTQKGCPYWKAKAENILADTSIMNYHVLMSDIAYVRHFGRRPLMFCDEAHNIENIIMQEVSIEVSEKWYRDTLGRTFKDASFDNTDVEFWTVFVELLIIELDKLIDNPYTDIPVHTMNRIKRQCDSLKWKYNQLTTANVEWIVNADKRNRTISIKPLDVKEFSYEKLFKASAYHVFLSGTFLDPSQWCDDLRIDIDDVKYIKSESSFDMPHNNPIHRKWVGNMSMKQKNKTLPKMAMEVARILEKHKDECGIIHCHSKENAKYLLDTIPNGRLLFYTDSNDKNEKLKIFESSNNLVMLGYSLEEGIDLPYDNVRFQVFLKTPFPNLGDRQVRARMTIDKNWYNVNTARKLIQAWGRGMRAEDDYCVNYMLDTGFNAIIKQDFMPDEFKEALV